MTHLLIVNQIISDAILLRGYHPRFNALPFLLAFFLHEEKVFRVEPLDQADLITFPLLDALIPFLDVPATAPEPR